LLPAFGAKNLISLKNIFGLSPAVRTGITIFPNEEFSVPHYYSPQRLNRIRRKMIFDRGLRRGYATRGQRQEARTGQGAGGTTGWGFPAG
jgi:hypothetical protein